MAKKFKPQRVSYKETEKIAEIEFCDLRYWEMSDEDITERADNMLKDWLEYSDKSLNRAAVVDHLKAKRDEALEEETDPHELSEIETRNIASCEWGHLKYGSLNKLSDADIRHRVDDLALDYLEFENSILDKDVAFGWLQRRRDKAKKKLEKKISNRDGQPY